MWGNGTEKAYIRILKDGDINFPIIYISDELKFTIIKI